MPQQLTFILKSGAPAPEIGEKSGLEINTVLGETQIKTSQYSASNPLLFPFSNAFLRQTRKVMYTENTVYPSGRLLIPTAEYKMVDARLVVSETLSEGNPRSIKRNLTAVAGSLPSLRRLMTAYRAEELDDDEIPKEIGDLIENLNETISKRTLGMAEILDSSRSFENELKNDGKGAHDNGEDLSGNIEEVLDMLHHLQYGEATRAIHLFVDGDEGDSDPDGLLAALRRQRRRRTHRGAGLSF